VWTENISTDKFRVCVHDVEGTQHDNGMSIMWMAYPPHTAVFDSKTYVTESSEESWTAFGDTHCAKVAMHAFSRGAPQIKVSATHRHLTSNTLLHNPTTIWLEDTTSTQFTLCARRVSLDRPDDKIFLNWMAVGEGKSSIFLS
jgi:hypothetical protein